MKIGKLPNEVLEEIVISAIKNKREEVVERAAVGRDCAVIDYGDKYCVLSTDPITGAEKNLGKIAVNVACNDIAAGGAEPIALLITILAPPNTSKETIREIMEEANEESRKLNVEIVGGHTEVTNAVNRMILSLTAIGIKEKLPTNEPHKIGDYIIMTKYAGMEGSAILAEEKEKELLRCQVDEKEIESAKNYINFLSVVKEGMIASKIGVKYMHDITEGGVAGAVWEAAKAMDMGVLIDESTIPVTLATKKICDCFDLDYTKLISSGSMLMIASPERYNVIKDTLFDHGILATKIGELVEEGVNIKYGDKIMEIKQPSSDELYKVV
jgi:hydrogenase expression/formation protein HypE